jgi:hypothetical protein
MPSGDAELLELGRKFEAALAQSREASEKYDAICERVHLRADAKACRSKDTAAYLKAWEKAWDAEGQPARDAEKAPNDADWRLDGLYQKIAALIPTTLAGAGVRARATMYTARHWWDTPLADLDWPEKHCRMLIETLCEAAGLPPIPHNSRASH